VRVGARGVGAVHDRQLLRHQVRLADLLGQRDDRDQPGSRDQIRAVERDINQAMAVQ